MNIYFSGSISGGREYQSYYEVLVKILANYGTVLTLHIASADLSAMGEMKNSRDIFDRDLHFLKQADIIIADVSTPSLGVGYELAWGIAHSKPVYALFHEKSGKRLSAMVDGNPDITVIPYESPDDFQKIAEGIFSL